LQIIERRFESPAPAFLQNLPHAAISARVRAMPPIFRHASL
jgi:hypothetical protein